MRCRDSADNGNYHEGDGEMMRRELNEFQNEVLEYTGLSIPRFAHRRNRVRCSDCCHWFKACKCIGKEIADEDKFADAWGVNIHPGVICGKCGRKYWTKADKQSVALPDFRKVSKRRMKIRKAMENNDD